MQKVSRLTGSPHIPHSSFSPTPQLHRWHGAPQDKHPQAYALRINPTLQQHRAAEKKPWGADAAGQMGKIKIWSPAPRQLPISEQHTGPSFHSLRFKSPSTPTIHPQSLQNVPPGKISVRFESPTPKGSHVTTQLWPEAWAIYLSLAKRCQVKLSPDWTAWGSLVLPASLRSCSSIFPKGRVMNCTQGGTAFR